MKSSSITFRDSQIPAIYCIENSVTGKKYVGKTNNLFRRFVQYRNDFKSKRYKSANRYLSNAVEKYGSESFTMYPLQFAERELLADLELQWMLKLRTIEREYGFNLRLDSSSRTVLDVETRKIISKNTKTQWQDAEAREKKIKGLKLAWKNNKERKVQHVTASILRNTRNYYYIFYPNGEIVKATRQDLINMKLVSVEAKFSISKSNAVYFKKVWIVRVKWR